MRRPPGAFERPMACEKLQRTAALQNAHSIQPTLNSHEHDTVARFAFPYRAQGCGGSSCGADSWPSFEKNGRRTSIRTVDHRHRHAGRAAAGNVGSASLACAAANGRRAGVAGVGAADGSRKCSPPCSAAGDHGLPAYCRVSNAWASRGSSHARLLLGCCMAGCGSGTARNVDARRRFAPAPPWKQRLATAAFGGLPASGSMRPADSDCA